MDWGKIQRPPEDSVSCNGDAVSRGHKAIYHGIGITATVL